MAQTESAVGAPLERNVRPLAERLRDCAQGVDLGADGMGWSPDPNLMREAAAEIERLRGLYEELLFAVGHKHPGETRHQTALRYIQRAEAPDYPFGGQGGGLTTCDMHDDESY